jgi:hypothetical protein
MPKKLTLNIDEELITFAHYYSQKNSLSISKLFEQYLIRLQNTAPKYELHSKTKSLYGVFEDSPLPDKKILRETFFEKDFS